MRRRRRGWRKARSSRRSAARLPDFHRLDIPLTERREPTALAAWCLRVDRFGNLVTNIDRKTFEAFAKQGEFRIVAGGAPVGRLVSTYAEIGAGEVCALFGSSDHLELAANAASAADSLGLAKRRDRGQIRRGLELRLISSPSRTSVDVSALLECLHA